MKKKHIIIIISAAVVCVLSAIVAFLYFGVKVDISLKGSDSAVVQVFADYEDEGCTAKYLWFDLSDKVCIKSDVDVSKLGEYSVSYTLKHHGKDYALKRNVSVVDTTPPEISLSGEDIIVSAMKLYTEPGYSATDNYDGDLSSDVTVEVGETVDDICIITYTVSDTFGNTAVAERTVTVKDIVPPVLTVSGERDSEVYTPFYTDEGCTAVDDLDGDISANIVVSTDYKSGTEGQFVFNYTVSDAAGNTATAQRRITVFDVAAPEIRLAGGSIIYMCKGDVYTEPGFSAVDAFDGDVSGSVTVSGAPDTFTAGEYVITYSAMDTKGNAASVSRRIRVYERPTPVEGAVVGGGIVSDSTVYLTFDDGPSSSVTPRVLDILRDNNIKATFFIVNYSDANKWLIERMIAEGHSIGIHGYSHDYGTIYSSVEAFLSNIETLRRRLINDFGYTTNLIRFPGGSSNKVSSYYTAGIMSRLCPLLESMGYVYFDWNVSSGDAAGGYVTAANIYNNVSDGLRHGRGNIVLMHDTNAKGTTADALQNIINFGNANGYTFAGLSSYTDGAHHSIQN